MVVLFVLVSLALLAVLPFGLALSSLADNPAVLGEVLSSARIWRLLGGTVGLGVSTALFAALLGVPVGRAVVRSKGWLTTTVGWAVPLPLVLPPWILGVVWSRYLPLSGWAGATFLLGSALWPLVAMFSARGFRQAALAGDAARLSRGWRAALWRVELPLAAPSILAGMLLVFLFAITDFAIVDFLSFYDPEPFTVLSNEIFQKWARLQSAPEAAAVSLPAIVPSLLALGWLLRLERRSDALMRDQRPSAVEARPAGPLLSLGLLVIAALALLPPVVLFTWMTDNETALQTMRSAGPQALRTVLTGLGSGAVVAVLGLAVARLSLRWRGWRGTLVLAAALLPLAAPGVMFGIGQIRLWNHPANPVDLYASPWLLILATAGRFLPLGVLAARAWLLRQDPGPVEALALVPRSAAVRWWRVGLPLTGPAVGLGFALGYLLTVRELDLVTTLPAGSSTLSQKIYSFVHLSSDSMTATLCVVLVALVIVPALAARLMGVPGMDCGTAPRER